MANTKKTSASKKEAELKTETEAVAAKTVEEPKPVEKPQSKATTKKKLTPPADDVRVKVRSNQYGRMAFVNSRNGDRTQWSKINEVQEMTVADIRDMKSNAARFLEESWIVVEEIEGPEYEGLTIDQIYDLLVLNKFANTGRPRYLSDIVKWDRSEIAEGVQKMSQSTKDNAAVALNTEIQHGNLTDLSLIRTWEEALGMQLDIDLAPTGVR